MVEIIEQNDYNKPADGENVIEIDENGVKRKLFKIQEGVWINPVPKKLDKEIIFKKISTVIYDENYCSTPEAKSKYLAQMTALFKRVNATEAGGNLLELISKGAPADLNASELWTPDNLIAGKKISCIIRPRSHILKQEVTSSAFKKYGSTVATQKATMYFHPDIVYSIKNQNTLNYFDPALALYHELTHVLHTIYGMYSTNITVEEGITVHGGSAVDWDTFKKRYKLQEKLIETARRINAIENLADREYFAKKFLLKKQGNDYIYNEEKAKELFENILAKHAETKFTQELGVEGRSNYDQVFFYPFQVNVADHRNYTIERGLSTYRTSITERELPFRLWPADKIRFQNPIEEQQYIDMLGTCSRNKRSLRENCPPLEPLYVDFETVMSNLKGEKTKTNSNSRSKRATETCLSPKDMFEKLDTAYNKAKEIPQKLLKGYAKGAVPVVAEKPVNFKEFPAEIPASSADTRKKTISLETFKIGRLVGFDRLTAQDMLDARRVGYEVLQDNTKNPVTFEDVDLRACINCSDKTFIRNKKISANMKSMQKTGKAIIKGAPTKIATMAQFGLWINTLREDFKEGSGVSPVHKVRDLLAVVPYVGDAMNIGVNIEEEDYGELVQNLGMFIFLELMPQFALPMMLVGLFIGLLKKQIAQKKMLEEAVWNILMEREQLFDTSLRMETIGLARETMQKIRDIAEQTTQQTAYNIAAMVHNIRYYADHNKLIKTPDDQKEFDEKLTALKKELWKDIDSDHRTMLSALYKGLRKTVIDSFMKATRGDLSTFNQESKNIIREMLETNGAELPKSTIDEIFVIVEQYMKKNNLNNVMKKELQQLANLIDREIDLLEKEKVPLFHIRVDDNNIIRDMNNIAKTSYKTSIPYRTPGRNSEVLQLKPGCDLTITHEELRYTTLNNDFTLDFWIKIPSSKDLRTQINRYRCITLLMDNSTSRIDGWSLWLVNGLLKFTMNKQNDEYLNLYSRNMINDTWTKITVINNTATKCLQLFVNGEYVNTRFCPYDIPARQIVKKINKQVSIALNEGVKDNPGLGPNFYYLIDDFKIYNRALSSEDIKNSYKASHHGYSIYDVFGDSIRLDGEYYMVNSFTLSISEPTTYVALAMDQDNRLSFIKTSNLDEVATIKFEYTKNQEGFPITTDPLIKDGSLVHVQILNPHTKHFTYLGVNKDEKAISYKLTEGNKIIYTKNISSHKFNNRIHNKFALLASRNILNNDDYFSVVFGVLEEQAIKGLFVKFPIRNEFRTYQLTKEVSVQGTTTCRLQGRNFPIRSCTTSTLTVEQQQNINEMLSRETKFYLVPRR